MRRIFLLLFACCTVFFAEAQSCKEVKTGRFSIPVAADNPVESVLIRTAEHQIEEIKSQGIRMQFDIKWTSECSYELSKPKVLEGEVPFPVEDSHVLYVTITKVTSSYYTAEITANFMEGKMIKNINILK